ncbi:MAG: ribosomal RNA small subunit methyltransferase A [Zetaproteobacteria bacterium]|nr:MAG: ribosomal RNA small subunit methyltransferase A [Zetaproteobacteria bacterium]
MKQDPAMAKKSLGQHFLRDPQAIDRILSLLPRSCSVLEIGPGLGALTTPLLERCERLVLIEKDDRFAEHWRHVARRRSGLHVVHADVMQCLTETVTQHRPEWILGNLPYNISGPLTALLASYPLEGGMVLMYQREVAERICAGPGSRLYGNLSVLVRHYYEPKICLRLPPGAFCPPPKVHSAVVLLKPRGLPLACTYTALQKTVRLGFAHRRKTLRNNFRGILDEEQMLSLGIDPGLRPEQLDQASWTRLAQAIGNVSPPPPASLVNDPSGPARRDHRNRPRDGH